MKTDREAHERATYIRENGDPDFLIFLVVILAWSAIWSGPLWLSFH